MAALIRQSRTAVEKMESAMHRDNLKPDGQRLLLGASRSAQIFQKEIFKLDDHRRAGMDLQRQQAFGRARVSGRGPSLRPS